ncbi:MAG: imidazole glycerol phosphate synthase subunit HisH [bacterium]
MIAVVDYGMGNLESVSKALKHLGFDVIVTSETEKISNAEGIVLPGVGAFPDCMENLRRLNLVEVVKDAALKKPFLGICLGLQLLFEESEEFGTHKGLAVFKGKVKKFKQDMVVEGERLKIPHMGWNSISIKKETPFLNEIEKGSYFYFVHSYYVETEADLVATETFYGVNFVSSIAKDRLFACQFHPEKSQKVGLKLLENFGKLVKGGK